MTRPATKITEATLASVRHEALSCRRCELYKNATQTVFGEGPVGAGIMFVAEQPGDKEDQGGRPLIGPAGQMFERCLAEVGLSRDRCYLTNAVKHFRHIQRGKKRLHQRPSTSHIEACRWWLEQEIELVHPQLIVALGATAVQSLSGKPVRIADMRGRLLVYGEHIQLLVTIHPSYLLRLRSRPDFEKERALFLKELAMAADFAN